MPSTRSPPVRVGMTIMAGGFGLRGTPMVLTEAIEISGMTSLTICLLPNSVQRRVDPGSTGIAAILGGGFRPHAGSRVIQFTA